MQAECCLLAGWEFALAKLVKFHLSWGSLLSWICLCYPLLKHLWNLKSVMHLFPMHSSETKKYDFPILLMGNRDKRHLRLYLEPQKNWQSGENSSTLTNFNLSSEKSLHKKLFLSFLPYLLCWFTACEWLLIATVREQRKWNQRYAYTFFIYKNLPPYL